MSNDLISRSAVMSCLREQQASIIKVIDQLEELQNDADMRTGTYEDYDGYDNYEQGAADAFREAVAIVSDEHKIIKKCIKAVEEQTQPD